MKKNNTDLQQPEPTAHACRDAVKIKFFSQSVYSIKIIFSKRVKQSVWKNRSQWTVSIFESVILRHLACTCPVQLLNVARSWAQGSEQVRPSSSGSSPAVRCRCNSRCEYMNCFLIILLLYLRRSLCLVSWPQELSFPIFFPWRVSTSSDDFETRL